MRPATGIRFAVAFTILLASALSLGAQPYARTFVSAQFGNDTNNCLPATPCRSFAKALTNTSAGGELIVLDSGGYGSACTITQAVQIEAAPGVYAGMTPVSGPAIIVNAPGARVRIDGVRINSAGSYGIAVVAVDTLYVERMSTTGTLRGLSFTVPGKLVVRESSFSASLNGGGGIYLEVASPDFVQAVIDHVTFEGNYVGLWGTTGAKIDARDCLAAHNEFGYVGQGTTEGNYENCVATQNNGDGFDTNAGSVMRLSNCTATHNGTGLWIGGTMYSRGNNTIENNTADVAGTLGSYAAK